MSDAVVYDLGERLAIAPEVRRTLAVMRSSNEIEGALRPFVTKLPHAEQRALMTVVAFAVMGSALPANITLIERMPMVHGLGAKVLEDAFEELVEKGILEYREGSKSSAGYFHWTELEHLIGEAMEQYDAPAIIGLDGKNLKR